MIRITLAAVIVFIGTLSSAQSPSDYDYIPDASYAEIEERLEAIEGTIPLHFNTRVKGFVDYFTVRDREYTREILNRKDHFFRLFEKYLAKYNMPDELKYLSIVESGLRPDAVSVASAVGLWQFISSTGKMYGLKNDWYLDDRMDPEKATDAACRHLLDLYRMFDDWELAMAAYNCGPGNVRKAIRRSGYKKEFWEIYRYLPRETRGYVPQFVAIMYTMNYAEEHNLYPEELYQLPEYDTVMVSQYMHLETFADQLNVCLDDMLQLNTNIKRGALPEGTKDFALKIPADMKEFVVANRTQLYDSASRVGKEELEYLARNMPGSTWGRERIVYRVRSGDVLGLIANRHNVRVSDIKEWNNLNSTLIRVGQPLSIWVLPNYTSGTKDLYASARSSTTGVSDYDIAVGNAKSYDVKPGDTLWQISKNTNVSVEQLKKLNNLNSNTIQPGQRLIIDID